MGVVETGKHLRDALEQHRAADRLVDAGMRRPAGATSDELAAYDRAARTLRRVRAEYLAAIIYFNAESAAYLDRLRRSLRQP